jgi:AP-3 complex subunit mu
MSFSNTHVFQTPEDHGSRCVSLHQSVDSARFEKDGVLSFIPPDGKFRLLEYILPLSSPPFTLDSNMVFGDAADASLELTLNVRSMEPGRMIESVALVMTLPNSTTSVKSHVTKGNIHFDSVRKTLRWNVGKIEFPIVGAIKLNANVYQDGEEGDSDFSDGVGVVHVAFRIPGHSVAGVSGLCKCRVNW